MSGCTHQSIVNRQGPLSTFVLVNAPFTMSLALCRAEPHPLSLPHLPTGRNPEENPEAMEEFKKFVQQKGLKVENILVREIHGENRAVLASPESPMSLPPVCAPKPCLSLCFCVLSVPGLIVPYVLFPVCPCPCVSVVSPSLPQGHNVTFCASVPRGPHGPPSLLCFCPLSPLLSLYPWFLHCTF